VVFAHGVTATGAEEALTEVARLAGLARARADERARLNALALTDALTGIRNRRAFDQRIADEHRRARSNGRRLALAVFDIDRFKHVNDLHGHAAGDDTLRAVCTAIAAQARSEDLVARIGGEEIAWLMPGADSHDAQAAAVRALEAIRSLDLDVGRVTASCGTAELVDADASPRDLVRRADRALYRAKDRGRDRVEPAAPPREPAA
jgi:diguanylate cyclase (GGDEF)-like protein